MPGPGGRGRRDTHSNAIGVAVLALVAVAASMVLARPSESQSSRLTNVPRPPESKPASLTTGETTAPIPPTREPDTNSARSESDKKAPVSAKEAEPGSAVEPILRKQVGTAEYLVYPHEIVWRFSSVGSGEIQRIEGELRITPFGEDSVFFAAVPETNDAILVLTEGWNGFVEKLNVGVFAFADSTYSTYELSHSEMLAVRRARGTGDPFLGYALRGWICCLVPHETSAFALWFKLSSVDKDRTLAYLLQPLKSPVFAGQYTVSVMPDKLVIDGGEQQLLLEPPGK